MKKVVMLLTAALVATAAHTAFAEVSTSDLLQEMISFESLAKSLPPGTRLVQFSSYDRRTKIDNGDTVNWWANVDLGHYLRSEETERGVEYVMAEADGPGALVRMWSANPGSRTWRIYIDDMEEPMIEAKGKGLLGGEVGPFTSVFADRRNWGANFIFPLPFSKACKVTVAYPSGRAGAKPPLMYYHVDLRLYPQETDVRSFSMQEIDRIKQYIEDVASVLSSPNSIQAPEGERHKAALDLAPGASADLFELTGPSAVALFSIKATAKEKDLAEVLGKTLLTMHWDKEPGPGVSAPLGDFFGTSPGANHMHSLPASVEPVEGGARLTSRWVMPFQDTALISLANQASKRAEIEAELIVLPWQWDKDSLYFHACYREKSDIPTRPYSDMLMLAAEGKGHFVGLLMNVRNPMEYFWWGEGDEKIWVDHDEFPSIFGTGTEDYFGYAWCIQYFKFTHAYHGVSLPTKEWLAVAQVLPLPGVWEGLSKADKGRAVVSQYRWHFIDAIPFEQSIKFYMEIMHHKKTEIDVNATSFWYARPGSSDDAETPDLSNREIWTP